MKQQNPENVGNNTTDPEVNRQRSEIYKHRRGETFNNSLSRQGFAVVAGLRHNLFGDGSSALWPDSSEGPSRTQLCTARRA